MVPCSTQPSIHHPSHFPRLLLIRSKSWGPRTISSPKRLRTIKSGEFVDFHHPCVSGSHPLLSVPSLLIRSHSSRSLPPRIPFPLKASLSPPTILRVCLLHHPLRTTMSERGSQEYSVSTIPRSKEYADHIEHVAQEESQFEENGELLHYTKYPNRWSRIR